ncbi:MAG: BatA domain-containing protein, partial [Stellaceae bacterium]
MLALGPFAFAAPWLLIGLASLPILWWLLRVTPPAPRRVRFPALRLLLGLVPREETPAKTPLWLILLRMALAALIILALAHPLLNPRAQLVGSGPLVLAVDNGWSAARHWDERRTTLDGLIAQADREGRNVVLLPTAPLPGAAAPPPLSLLRPADAHAAVTELAPMPWPEDRQAALARLQKLDLAGGADLVWLSDGIDDGEAAPFAQGLAKLGALRVLADPPTELPRLLAAGNRDDKDLAVIVSRADASMPLDLYLRVLGDDGRLLARQQATLPEGALRKDVRLQMPSELRNRATQIQIEGEASAGAVLLLDERWRRRPVGVVVPHSSGPAQPLLNGVYYVEKALAPFSEVREGDVPTLLKGEIAVLILSDLSPNGPAEAAALDKWIGAGGTVLRFAGPRLAEETGTDTLLPVTLRKGGRTLGGALSWEKPARLAPFDASSPFAGLAIPEDVTIARQVLAEPTLDLGNKTWARLTDGTPLVTAEKRGKGWLVLVHTTADPEWSTLGISGLFVDMLRRIVALSQGVAGNSDKPLPPVETLDGYGRLQRASATASTIQAGGFAKTIASAKFPPGFYGTEDARQALNLAPAVKRFAALPELPPGVERASYAKGPEIDFRPGLLTAALALGLIDLLVAYA